MSIAKMADKALRRLVPNVTAGACVPDHGDLCGTYFRYYVCDSSGRRWASYWTQRVDCYGRCYWSAYAYRVAAGYC